MPLQFRAPIKESSSQATIVGIDRFGTMIDVNVIDLLQSTYTPEESPEDGGTEELLHELEEAFDKEEEEDQEMLSGERVEDKPKKWLF